MITLSSQAFELAKNFLLTRARPLEQALFRYHFENAPAEAAREALAAFRNPDGGFGRGLEADVQSPLSSALCTSLALHTLISLQTPASHPLVSGAVTWLMNSLDRQSLKWRALPPGTGSDAHAPWWNDENGSLEKTFDDFQSMPRAGIATALWHFPGLAPADLLLSLTEAVADAAETSTALPTSADALENDLELLAAPGLPPLLRQRLAARLKEIIPNSVEPNPQAWLNYSIEPLKLIPTPHNPAASWIPRDLIQTNLDFRIQQQSPEGCWEPNWSWFGQYPEVWETVALPAWRGVVTLKTLLSLRAWKRLK